MHKIWTVLSFLAAFWSACCAEPALITAGKVSLPPSVDGQLQDDAWKNASGAVLFPITEDNAAPRQQDHCRFQVCFDRKHLYFGAVAGQSYLDPVANRLEDVANHAAGDNDRRIFQDDVLEFFLLLPSGGEYWHLAVNSDGRICRSLSSGRGHDTLRPASGIQVAATKNTREWRVEVAIPFSLIGLPEGTRDAALKLGVFRRNNPKKEHSGWTSAETHFHQPERWGILRLNANAPQIQATSVLQTPGRLSLGLRLGKGEYTFSGKTDRREFTVKKGRRTLTLSCRGEAPDQPAQITIGEKTQTAPLFRTHAIRLDQSADAAELNLILPGAATLFADGRKLKNTAAPGPLRQSVPLISPLTVIGIEVDGNGEAFSGSMQLGPLVIHPEEWQTAVKAPEDWLSGDCNAADWALYDGGKVKGRRFFRFLVVHDHLRFAPQRPDRRIYMVNGTIQTLTLRIGSPGQWMLPDYSLNLELPGALSVPLYESGKRTYNRYAHDLQDTVSGEMRFLRFAYREPMPALPYNWGFHVANFLLDVRFPSSERAQTFPIRIYQRGRGVAEFPQKYELVILPELKPGKPERIMINLWDVERGSCFSTSEMNLILESFAQCGINYAGIHLLNDDDLIVSRRARELGMKTMMAHSGAHSPFLRKRLAEKPEHRAVNPVYPPQAWQTAMCPLAFQEDPWVRERFRCLCPHFDVMLDDVERGTRAACLCARCRAAFARRFQLRKIPEAKEIYERYPEQIELFQIEMNRKVFDFQLELARQVHPGIASMVYSGYDSARARNAYGIDWKRYRDLDFASCGYEMERRVIDATRKALNGAEIVCGLIIDSSMYENNLARQNLRGLLFHQLRNSGFGGILFWKWRELDGRGMTALADFSRGVAEFENFLDESRQCREGFAVSGMSTEDVTIYRDGDRYLVYAVNLSSRPRRLTVTSEVLPRGEAFDFFSARRFRFHKTFQVNIPAMDAALIMLKQGGH